MARCRVLLRTEPGRDAEVRRLWASSRWQTACGATIGRPPSLAQLLGPYDYVLALECSTVEEVALAVLHFTEEFKRCLSSTLTLLSQDGGSYGPEEDSAPTEAQTSTAASSTQLMMLLTSAPGQDQKVKKLLADYTVTWAGCRCDELFGPYDCFVEFEGVDLDAVREKVDELRTALGSNVTQTITMLKFPLVIPPAEIRVNGARSFVTAPAVASTKPLHEPPTAVVKRPLSWMMLLKCAPGEDQRLKDLLTEHVPDGAACRYDELFGAYDCFLQFEDVDLHGIRNRVENLRAVLGRTVVQTVTMLKFPPQNSPAEGKK